jgi:signal transduction histidine kinase/CheY-like chemotaxis protein/HPt (histidine-containing phosphotransfer) domain-containing protein
MGNSQSSLPSEGSASSADLHTGLAATERSPSGLDRAQRIEAEQVKLICTHASLGFQIGALTVGIVVLVLWDIVPFGSLMAWVGTMVLVTLPAFVAVWQFHRVAPRPDEISPWRRLLILVYGVAGLGWGAMGVLLFPTSLAHQVFLVFIAGSQAAGGMSVLSPVPAVFLAYLFSTLAPFTLRLFLQGNEVLAAMGLMLLAFSAALLGIGRHFHATLAESLKLRFENLDLVESLSTAKEQAEAANRAKSQFLANVSHELRTPMQGVLGTIELLLNTTLADSQRKMAHILHRSSQALLTIINDLLDFSKIEAGKLELEATDLDVRQTVAEVLELFAASASRKGLRLTSLVHDNVPASLRGDSVRLRQILTNLIGNAVKFTHRGEITIEVRCLDSKSQSHDARLTPHASRLMTPDPRLMAPVFWLLHFAVRDTGIGIAPKARKHIFEAFSQADGSTTRKYGGTGLGLSIAKQLTHLMGGEIGVESVVGKGSTFWFTVRLAPRPILNWATVAPSPVSKGRRLFTQVQAQAPPRARVLLAEDNPVNQDVTLTMLRNIGYQVDVVANGREVLAALSRASYDLVLMDCQMPEMDGFETTRVIRAPEAENTTESTTQRTAGGAQKSTPTHLPIIALTANAIQGDRERCLAAGMDDYLSKPFTQEQLAAALQPWLQQVSATREEQAETPSAEATTPRNFLLEPPMFSHVKNASPTATPSAARLAAVDFQALDRIRALQRDNAPALLDKVIQNYLSHSPQLLQALHEAVAHNDASALQKVAHSLKSSSATLGAATLAALCQDLETMGHKHSLEKAALVLSAATAEYETVREALSAELQREAR